MKKIVSNSAGANHLLEFKNTFCFYDNQSGNEKYSPKVVDGYRLLQ